MRQVTTYSPSEKKALIDAFENWKGPRESFYKAHAIPERTLYGWIKRAKNGSGAAQKVSSEPVGLEFNIVQAKEAKTWINRNSFGRFAAIKEALLSQVANLRKSQAIAFQAPKDPKEIKPLHHACYSALRKAGLPYGISYSKGKNLFVVMRRDSGENS